MSGAASSGTATPLADALTSELVELAAECSRNPLRFVLVAFPWGEAGTDLADKDGPDVWQRDVLQAIGDGMLSPARAIQLAISSGHGVGKSALVAWVILWAITTCEDARGILTANTAAQLATKTWPELNRWYRVFLWRSWFEVAATAIYSVDPSHEKTWRVDAIAWSADRTESFAGLHNAGKRLLVVFDEASAIPDVIWQTTEGALTDADTDIVWLVAGNPTRNTGRFRECFGRFKHRWTTRQIDSRGVRITNKVQIASWVEDYGEDSDFVRVRVKGVFPRAGSSQFIGTELAEAAARREIAAQISDALILGVDVARFGDDQSVIWFRKGRDARMIPPICLRGANTMEVAARVADEAARLRADAVFIDGGGVGGGVVDRCMQLRVHGVVEVQFGAKADRSPLDTAGTRSRNKRAEIWATMKAWLDRGGIPNDPELIADLTGPEYGFDADNALVLESKVDMKRRGLASPDKADALALTFAYPVQPSPRSGGVPMVFPRERRVFDPHAKV